MSRKTCLAALMVVCFIIVTGCAANNALNKPTKKDERVLAVGQEKDLVRAELGVPVAQSKDGCDIFNYQEGSRQGSKFVRAFVYGVFSIATLGVADILILNPVEGMIGTDRNRLRVCYDNDSRVSKVDRLEIKD